jgi:hypothetical protein
MELFEVVTFENAVQLAGSFGVARKSERVLKPKKIELAPQTRIAVRLLLQEGAYPPPEAQQRNQLRGSRRRGDGTRLRRIHGA